MVGSAVVKQQTPLTQVPDSSVVLDQRDVSPFAGADVRVPPDVQTSSVQHHQQLTKQHPHSSSSSSSKQKQRKPSVFARLFCCTAVAQEDANAPSTGVKHASLPNSPLASIRSQHSWGRVFAEKHHLQPTNSRTSTEYTEYHDARSHCSDITPQHSIEQGSPRVHGSPRHAAAADQQHTTADGHEERPHWVPPYPLLFAPPGLKFVPVPVVTGYAGVWDLIHERTSPHPQPIDVMSGANAIVRRVHASVPGIVIEEDEHFIKMIANPSFMPKGFPSAHIETFDKSHKTAPVWLPRRDLKLGSAKGHVWFTECGMLILRHETFGFMGKEPDYIVEDYLHLEDNGTVIVDRMCTQQVKTGNRAEQLQVVRLVHR